jgi:hypothetical protein
MVAMGKENLYPAKKKKKKKKIYYKLKLSIVTPRV